MGRTGITKTEVADAVSALRAENRPTTTRLVRLQLKKGSNATVSRLLDELGAKCTSRPSHLPTMPEHVRQRLTDGATSMWHAACEATSQEVTKVISQFEQRIQVLTAKLRQEHDARTSAQRELAETQYALSKSQANERDLSRRVTWLHEKLAAEQAVVKRCEREHTEMLKRLGAALSAQEKRLRCERGSSSAPGVQGGV